MGLYRHGLNAYEEVRRDPDLVAAFQVGLRCKGTTGGGAHLSSWVNLLCCHWQPPLKSSARGTYTHPLYSASTGPSLPLSLWLLLIEVLLMKVKKAVKRICEHCFSTRRRGKLFIICKKNPRHKQRQLYHTTASAAVAADPAAAATAALRSSSSCDACHSRWLLPQTNIYSSPLRYVTAAADGNPALRSPGGKKPHTSLRSRATAGCCLQTATQHR